MSHEEVRASVGIVPIVASCSEETEKGYYYSILSDEDKLIYADVLGTIKHRLSEVPICNATPASVQRIVDCVLADHPEIFYFENYNYALYTDEEIPWVYFSPVYSYDEDSIEMIESAIECYVETCFATLDSNASSYDKVKHFYEYVTENVFYDTKLQNNQYLDSVVMEKRSVCNGYSKAFQYLCYKADIPCIFVKGMTRNDATTHAWNIVEIDGDYYNVDCTWADSVGNTLSYDYLCLPDYVIDKTHIKSNKFKLPRCTSDSCNYYVKEGFFLNTFNPSETIHHLLENKQSFSLRCVNSEIFNDYVSYLFDNKNIFNGVITEECFYKLNEDYLIFSVYFNEKEN